MIYRINPNNYSCLGKVLWCSFLTTSRYLFTINVNAIIIDLGNMRILCQNSCENLLRGSCENQYGNVNIFKLFYFSTHILILTYILELCIVLVQAWFITSETEIDIYNHAHDILRPFDGWANFHYLWKKRDY